MHHSASVFHIKAIVGIEIARLRKDLFLDLHIRINFLKGSEIIGRSHSIVTFYRFQENTAHEQLPAFRHKGVV